MINGKPNLTFGGVSAPASGSTKANLRAGTSRAQDTFASFLNAGKSAPAQVNAQKTIQPVPASLRPTIDRSGRSIGFLPDSPQAQQSLSRPQITNASIPAGNGARSTARHQAQPGAEGLARRFAGSKRSRTGNKTSPRLSGTPITQRGDIGMVDTRKNAAARTASVQRANYVSPASTSARTALASAAGGAVGGRADAYSRYTSLIGGLGAAVSPQSFILQGLGGVNGQMALKNLGYEVQDTPSIQTYAQRLEADPYALKNSKATPPGLTLPRTRAPQRPAGEEGARTAILTASHRKKGKGTAGRSNSLVASFENTATQGLGTLAAKFESGADGVGAIGYDRKGGTSYGKFQIASRPGTMKNFINYLQAEAPDIAGRLQKAGPANTGGRRGKMPAEWRKIAEEQPDRFEKLQSDFIRSSHFEPAKRAIEEVTGVSFDQMPPAVNEVLFSTAVQHGAAGATRIISQAVRRVGTDKLQSDTTASGKKAEEQLITQIYNLRANQFVSSTSRVQAAVRSRLKQEMREAIQMLA